MEKKVLDIRLPDDSLLENYNYDVAKSRRAFTRNIMIISLCISTAIIVIVFLINIKDKKANYNNNA